MSGYLVARLLACLKRRVIEDECAPELGPYLTRYFLLQTPIVAIYLHRFHRSDSDRHLHDHPWSFVTLLLSSGYWEWTPDRCDDDPDGIRAWKRTWCRRFSLLRRPATWIHRVEIPAPMWTIVVRSRRRREWGFHTEAGFVRWQEYGSEWCE